MADKIKVSELDRKSLGEASENALLLLTEPGTGSYGMPLSDVMELINEAGGSISQLGTQVAGLTRNLSQEAQFRKQADDALDERVKNLEEGGTGQESGKVKVDAEGIADYLENLLLTESDTSPLTIQKIGGKLYFGVNLEGESDPKLKTIDESAINANTGNYGSWWTSEPPSWGDESGINVVAYRMKRVSDAQGILTKCRFALSGSFSGRPIFRIGVFDLNMNLLGASDTLVANSDKTAFVGQEHGDTYAIDGSTYGEFNVDLHEESSGSLRIGRNTRYVVELVSCGLQFAAKLQSGSGTTSNYVFDYNLENNLQTTYAGLKWWTASDGKAQAENVPWLSFGASDIGG